MLTASGVSVIPYARLRRLRKHRKEREEQLREERELREFMQAQDESYLNFVLYNPMFAVMMTGTLQAAYDGMQDSRPNIWGHFWNISFSSGKKCPGLRVATLEHDRLKIIIREQNATKTSGMAEAKRNGKLVFQVYVDNQPRVYYEDGEIRFPEVTTLTEMRQTS